MPEGTFVYFAYGSNMLTARLRKRCSTAQPVGTAIARGYSLSFCKRSNDGSGKATIVAQGDTGQEAHGVLFEIAVAQRGNLDSAEGAGYHRCDAFAVLHGDGAREVSATTYFAAKGATDDRRVPYDWYRALVLAGALEHRLPDPYIEELRALTIKADLKPQRPSRQAALGILRASGFPIVAGLIAATTLPGGLYGNGT
jgi:gamma-glutamylcyclotransferase